MLRWGFLKKSERVQEVEPATPRKGEPQDEWAYLRARPDFDPDEMAGVHAEPAVPAVVADRSEMAAVLEPDPELEAILAQDLEALEPSSLGELLQVPTEELRAKASRAHLRSPVLQARQQLGLDVRTVSNRVFRMVEGDVLVGRYDAETECYPEVDLRHDDAVSRRHARIWLEQGLYYLRDLGSTNGTLHNGRWLDPRETVELRAGDVIQMGDASLIHVVPVSVARRPTDGDVAEQAMVNTLDELFGASFVTTRMDSHAPAPPLPADAGGLDVLDLALDLGREDGIL